MEVIFRNVDRANLSELRKIAEIDVTIPRLFDSNFQNDERAILGMLDQLQNKIKEDDFFEVAAINSEIIGYHVVRKAPSQYSPDLQKGYVYTLWVHEEFRRKGIGTQLKQHAEDWARKNKLHQISTHVHKNNLKMLALNEKCGFELSSYQLHKSL